MTIIDAIILGVIQGASEFLPISSSGHLVIFQSLLGIESENIYLEVALHFGTLLAVLVYFRRDLVGLIKGFVGYIIGAQRETHSSQFRYVVAVVIGTIPVAIGGVIFKKQFEAAFDSVQLTGTMLLVSALFLLFTKYVREGERSVSVVRALVIGLAQLGSILPGISRSGATIATGMFLGMQPQKAARFSFILSVPAVSGAFLFKLLDAVGASIPGSELLSYAVGALVSFFVGLVAIHYLLKVIATHKFYLFGFWCLSAGFFTILYLA